VSTLLRTLARRRNIFDPVSPLASRFRVRARNARKKKENDDENQPDACDTVYGLNGHGSSNDPGRNQGPRPAGRKPLFGNRRTGPDRGFFGHPGSASRRCRGDRQRRPRHRQHRQGRTKAPPGPLGATRFHHRTHPTGRRQLAQRAVHPDEESWQKQRRRHRRAHRRAGRWSSGPPRPWAC